MKQEHKVSKELVDRMIEIHFPFSCNPYDVTVMEMLDVMPDKIEPENNDGFTYFYLEIGKKFVAYSNNGKAIKMIDGNLLNALAEMILWLHENKYITF